MNSSKDVNAGLKMTTNKTIMIKYAIERTIRLAFNTIGLDLHRIRPNISSADKLAKSLFHFNIDTVFDVGANIGQFARSLRQAGYKGRIISFEPLSEAHEKLREYAKDDSDWLIHPRAALGDNNGEFNINIAGNSVSSSLLEMTALHLNSAQDSGYIGTEKCTIQTLDSIASQYITSNNNIFLKIDTQGMEWEVLNGAVNTLPFIQGVMLEVSFFELYSGQKLWKEMIEHLEIEGFSIWSIDQEFTDQKSGKTLQCNVVLYRP
ncbi:FkbM family methyltransferase [Methylomonas sp. CM2]|uniref:FkbM family methyltransferase n=1 Tax=Methylomonas sp. CM2 TaxID=3417647 RepID=UPI003CE7BD17